MELLTAVLIIIAIVVWSIFFILLADDLSWRAESEARGYDARFYAKTGRKRHVRR